MWMGKEDGLLGKALAITLPTFNATNKKVKHMPCNQLTLLSLPTDFFSVNVILKIIFHLVHNGKTVCFCVSF